MILEKFSTGLQIILIRANEFKYTDVPVRGAINKRRLLHRVYLTFCFVVKLCYVAITMLYTSSTIL